MVPLIAVESSVEFFNLNVLVWLMKLFNAPQYAPKFEDCRAAERPDEEGGGGRGGGGRGNGVGGFGHAWADVPA